MKSSASGPSKSDTSQSVNSSSHVPSESGYEWEEIFNTVTDMITIHDKDFNIILANRSAEKHLNIPVLGDRKAKCFSVYHGTDRPPEGCPSCGCLITGRPATFELYEPHLGKFIEIRSIPRFDDSDRLNGLIHIVRDISERKKMEEENQKLLADIKKAKLELELTFDNASEIIVLVDRELHIIRCNRSFAEFTQLSMKDLVGMKVSDFLGAGAGGIEQIDLEGRTEIRTDSGRWIYLSFCPVLNADEEFIHSVLIGTDITKTKNIQHKLVQSEKELKERVRELEKFYETAIGRELRIQKLKRDIMTLQKEIAVRKRDKE